MAESIYQEIDNKTDLREVFLAIRKDSDGARSREDLTELYRRAGYLITLSYASSWEEKFGSETTEIRSVGKDEFARTARKINSRAEDLGTEANYDETWGD